MTAACRLSHHSPRFNGKDWGCPDCVADVKPSPLARLHAALDRSTADEWAVFVSALRSAVGPGGFISQTRVRPLIQAIPHKRRGQYYARAIRAGLLQAHGYEPSTDVAGKNAGKPCPTYILTERSAA